MNVLSKQSHKDKLDKGFTIGILILFAVVLLLSFSLSKTAGSVPKLISVIGIILCVISLFSKPKQNKVSQESTESSSEEAQGISFIKSFGLIIAYLLSMIVLGFLVSTVLMLFSMSALLGYRKYKITVMFSVITTAILYSSFVYLFYVRLPVGLLFELFR